MQRITYVNLLGEALVFGAAPPLVLSGVKGLGRPDVQAVRAQGAYQAGETIHRMQTPSRVVEVTFEMPPCESREALYRERMRVEAVLTAGRCFRDGRMGTLVYENDAGCFVMDAVPEGSTRFGKRVQHAFCGNRLSFLCPTAYMRMQGVCSAVMRMSAGEFRLPTALPVRLGTREFSAQIKNSGTVNAPLQIVIHGTGEMPSIVNHTTGAKIGVRRKIAAGERLELNTDPRALSCVLVHQDGLREDAFGYLDPSSAVSAFVLRPGLNDVEYMPSAPSAKSRLELSWYAWMEGV